MGEGAGPKKLETIKKLGIDTVDEDGFLDLIATRKGVLDAATKEKMKKDEEKIKKDAKEMEVREREAAKEAEKAGGPAKYVLEVFFNRLGTDATQSFTTRIPTVDIQVRSSEPEGYLW